MNENKASDPTPEVTSDEHTPDEHTPDEHTPDEHTPDEHTPDEHTPDEHTPDEHTPDKHTPDEHTLDEHTPREFASHDDMTQGDKSRHDVSTHREPPEARPAWTRRHFLTGTSLAVGAGLVGAALWRAQNAQPVAPVTILKAENYDDQLANRIRDGLIELGINRHWIAKRRVLLKPNIVEPSTQAPHINTHPAMVRAAIEVFRGFDAEEVIVAEGQGHCRDTYLVLEQSGFYDMLKDARTNFVDLNHDDVFEVTNKLNASKMKTMYLPQTLRSADLIVSMPKMKTHHWAGATLSMKNFFGVMPGICYGWPKNVLHHAGIPQSIVDITATVQPHLAIVDGVVGMEGDEPIMGEPIHSGLIVLGTNLPAVDATAVRVMGLDPYRLPYLQLAARRMSAIHQGRIEQRGEPIVSVRRPFRLLNHPNMRQFQS